MATGALVLRFHLATVAALLAPVVAWSAVTVSCDEGCRPVTACAGNAAPHLLCLKDRNSDVKLSWRVDTPLKDGDSLRVFAGNPARAAGIPERQVAFTTDGNSRVGSFTFKPEDLGTGPLLVITTLQTRRSESLLSWIPFRTSTAEETRDDFVGAEPAGSWSVDVVPAFIQISAGWRELPRTRDTLHRTWFSLKADPMFANDADLDGAVSGAPGLVMQVSAPWHAREDWKNKVRQALGIPEKHAVKFETLHWEEKPDRTIEGAGDLRPISLRNYYTVVTLYTNASTATYAARDMGLSGNGRYYAHETSASLKQVNHPMLWSSYSLNDYGSDHRLLGMLRDHVATNGPTLELGPALGVNGDGGAPIYRAAFTVRVRPWSDESTRTMQQPHAGVVGVDVLAVRTGMGGIKVPAANATGVQSESLCRIWDCGADDGLAAIDFNKPPRGWEVSPPASSTLTTSGQIPLMDGVASIADKSPNAAPAAGPPKFPATAQFALAASLQSGALVRRGGLFGHRVDGIVPINSYAQYVLRFTVATFPGQELVTTDTAVVASADEIGVVTITPRRPSLTDWIVGWVRDHWVLSGTLMLVAFVALLLLVPGFRSLVSAFLGSIAALIRRITPKTNP